ncbi:MAG: reactive intermediate/imine deaminase [Deltaproteobacteria bacterium RIFCSPHIGHO2_12_FULL_43_9]|nr:MAG: reactive intermediate/imine deaminase [Deltaproteobacteria bacterium RIFCSPHIGHO2_12_FULL_43_9]
MSKKIIKTDKAPAAIGPYSQGIATGNLVFLSGQIPINPTTGSVVSGDIVAQTEQVLKNLQAVLSADGLSFDNVVKTTVYLSDMNEFTAMNEVYGKYFKINPPARATVQVARLPKDVKVEIDLIAVK